jgi:hypothetical protein
MTTERERRARDEQAMKRRCLKAVYERKRRARLKAAGFVPVTVHVRPDDKELVKAYAEALTLME